MRINAHTHIFNFKSVLGPPTVDFLANRLKLEGVPKVLRDAIIKALKKHFQGEIFDETALLRTLAGELNVADGLKSLVAKAGTSLHPSLSILLEGDVEGLSAEALREILGRLSDAIIKKHPNDPATHTLEDMIEFLKIGIKPTILAVADDLMLHSGDDTVVVALMMDITAADADDEKQFERQLRDTAEAALAYPGRILPFVAVNTLRKTHFEHLVSAIDRHGFVGVKLYPSLGFRLDTTEMDRVFAHCSEHDIPLLMHCNQGGFALNEQTVAYSTPELWRDVILPRYPDLRICFGHFGGDEFLTGASIDPQSWTGVILELMLHYPGVYADISYHDDPMRSASAEANYFRNLKDLLSRATIRDRILFGSDYFLVRQQVRDDNLWRYFETRFTPQEFARLSEANPTRFLGLPNAAGVMAPTIRSHLGYLLRHKWEVRRDPHPWVLTALASQGLPTDFIPNEFGLAWTTNNEAHWHTWQFFRTRMHPADAARDFAYAGRLRMRDLNNWPSESMSSANRPAALRKFASDLHIFFVKGTPKAITEEGVTAHAAQEKLAGEIGKGDTTLAELGPAVDALYRFKREQT